MSVLPSSCRDRGPAADTGFEAAPGIVLLLFFLLTSIVAHTQAGGMAPGPGGLLVTGLALGPLALAVNRFAHGPVALLFAGVLGQLTAHVALSIVTPAHHAASHDAPTTYLDGSHAAHHQAAVMTGNGTQWSFNDAVLGHITDMGAGMAFAHLLAALVTAWLVTAGLRGLRRAAGTVLAVILRIIVPETPPSARAPRATRVATPKEPYLVVLGGRAPPALS